MDDNKKWMSSGKIGCTFAALFAKNPEKVDWVTIVNPKAFFIPDKCVILSLQFPEKNMGEVKNWAINNGFYIENIDGLQGLRLKIDDNISWVQYFGPDSPVKTRQTPIPELCMCVRLPKAYYWKVGFKGILHLAHTSVSGIAKKAQNILWKTSFENTTRKLRHKPTIKEAAKITYHE